LIKKVLIIASVWPETVSSAAGYRMVKLVKAFNLEGYKVFYASTAAPSTFSDALETLNTEVFQWALNDSSINATLENVNPDVVVFDRFMVEEQFAWRVSEICPNALRVLNTEDLHCLRHSRAEAVRKGQEWSRELLKISDFAKREIASILRCDLSLLISSYEIALLKEVFKIDGANLFHLPFDGELPKSFIPLESRTDFVWIGNFKHQPNWDAVLQLKTEVWPLIRKQLPKANMLVYGAYPDEKAQNLNNPKEGFLIKGRADNAQEVLSKAKVCLAPLRFGAGLKGKLFESMLFGTPSVTTPIGAEGMCATYAAWNGAVADNWQDFAQKAVELYCQEQLWVAAQKKGMVLIKNQFYNPKLYSTLMDQINTLGNNLVQHREANFYGNLLQHHSYQSTRFMSKWIEEKNKEAI